MKLWCNGSEDGCVLLVGTQADIAPVMDLPGDSIMLLRKQPIDELIDEIGPRPVRAIVLLIFKLIRPAALQDGALSTLKPTGTWRVIEDQTYVFVVRNGVRICMTAEELANVANKASILADRIGGHWVLR